MIAAADCDADMAVGKPKPAGRRVSTPAASNTTTRSARQLPAALTFNGDKAHFDKAGATEMAQLAAQELTRIAVLWQAYLK